MALRTFHPCRFNFQTTNIRRVGNVVDGGTTLSGFNDTIETDGGGFWVADFTEGEAIEREDGLAWRAQTDDMGAGSKAVIVLLCAERHFQPVLDRPSAYGTPPNTPIADDAPDKGANYTVTADAALRATTLHIAGVSELPIIGGEKFSIQHPTWGWRVYLIGPDGLTDDGTISFNPPLREAVTSGTALEFDTPRCQMRPAQKVDNQTDQGVFTSCAISFVEDMRKPAA
jgi:hypothetical protein